MADKNGELKVLGNESGSLKKFFLYRLPPKVKSLNRSCVRNPFQAYNEERVDSDNFPDNAGVADTKASCHRSVGKKICKSSNKLTRKVFEIFVEFLDRFFGTLGLF